MTDVFFDIDELNNSVMLECINHSDDYATCMAVSSLCNVLVQEAFRVDKEPTIYKPGHVRIDLFNISETTRIVFEDVLETFRQLAEQEPEHVRMY